MAQSQNSLLSPVSPLPPITYKGHPVITTEMLAHAYECKPKHIRQNFANNKERFVEGKHFYTLTNSELRAFRDCVDNFGSVVPPRTRNLTLWLERGAARHAKMLNTDKAWDVFELLEETFFRVVQPQAALPSSTLTPDQQCTLKNMVDALAAKGMKHAALWSRFNNHFRIAKYSQLPQERMGEAIQYLMGLKLEPEQKALPPVQSSPDAALNELFRELNSHVDATYDVERRIYELLREVQAPALNVFGSFKKNLAIRSHETNESLWYAHGRTMEALQSNCRLMVLAARG